MTSPAIFETGNYFRQTIGLTSTATMVTDFRTVAVTNALWTEPSTKLFKTPVDADGRFMDVLLTETSTTRLGWRVRDQNAVTICDREIDISGTVTIDYYAGPHFAAISNITNSEVAHAFILSEEPESQIVHTVYTIGNAFRTSAASNDGTGNTVGQYYALDNGVSTFASRIIANTTTGGTAIPLINRSGAKRFIPKVCNTLFDASNRRIDGALYNAVLCDSSFLFNDIATLSIGNAGETGDFKCVSLATAVNCRVMFRKGTTV